MDRRHGVGSGPACPFDWCRFDGASCPPLRLVARLGDAACVIGPGFETAVGQYRAGEFSGADLCGDHCF